MLQPPLKIFVGIDKNELEYLRYDKIKKRHEYRYTKSITKMGMILPFTEEGLEKFLRVNSTMQLTVEAEELGKSKRLTIDQFI